ncbi:thiosulfate sulfurtransferase GlpE [Methylocystis parvus]|uniref:Thiosulfate sulfurtransferase GlpE n=1 Tax=Methylocystis parvus TaxID=134 RepID=A0A6B8M1Q2_9HYPH|nr:thiosulfate sulfurtransferase GlpE [Methylocystis parvus]QGM97734.1 thiosulfate sulfurtransferase GlpE [Methylocystis parvus]WBK01963.1 thiosulfate sulfurtransferase GlpE [Methylocystis parvus OBBP]
MTKTDAFHRIDVAAARALLRRGPISVIDIRDSESFARGHIDGALLATQQSFSKFLGETSKESPVLVCCYHGHSSQPVAKFLAEYGFAQVYSLDGGYEAWAAVKSAAPDSPALSPALQAFLAELGVPPDEVNRRDKDGATPLMRAVRLETPALAQELLRAGADLHAVNNDGNQALWLACVAEVSETIQFLIDAGAELQHVNATGATPLMFAASSGRAKAVTLLLAAGADPLLETALGLSALDMASTAECLSLMREAVRRRTPPPAG